jgi:hypothetical protein
MLWAHSCPSTQRSMLWAHSCPSTQRSMLWAHSCPSTQRSMQPGIQDTDHCQCSSARCSSCTHSTVIGTWFHSRKSTAFAVIFAYVSAARHRGSTDATPQPGPHPSRTARASLSAIVSACQRQCREVSTFCLGGLEQDQNTRMASSSSPVWLRVLATLVLPCVVASASVSATASTGASCSADIHCHLNGVR